MFGLLDQSRRQVAKFEVLSLGASGQLGEGVFFATTALQHEHPFGLFDHRSMLHCGVHLVGELLAVSKHRCVGHTIEA